MLNITNPKFTDCYFTKSREAAAKADLNPLVVYQLFQKKESVFAGLELVRPCFDKAEEVWSLLDGMEQSPFEPSMIIKARFQDFCELETTLIGTLARCTMVATNVRAAVKAASGKPVLFFPARFDIPEAQFCDGYAAAVGGATGCATQEQTNGFVMGKNVLGKAVSNKPVGTMPHAMIAVFGGDTAAATLAFAAARPNEDVWSLVDFDNNCAKTAVDCAKVMQEHGMIDRFKGVRLDTSEKLIDKGIQAEFDTLSAGLGYSPERTLFHGVTAKLVRWVRKCLDDAGFPQVQIAVSGGFSPLKISQFECQHVPADVYAIGESFIRGSNAYTADIVGRFDGNKLLACGKVGRELKPSTRLVQVKGASATA